MRQLALPIALARHSRLAQFVVGDNHASITALRQQLAGEQPDQLHLSGGPGAGKTHLLQAACRELREQGGSAGYLPLSQHQELHPDLLQGMECNDLVALDDVQAIAGLREWEVSLFNLYNAVRARGQALLSSADRGPAQLPLTLPDLRSRLGAGASFALSPLGDQDLGLLLRRHADDLGVNDLSDEVVAFVLRRVQRDTHHLVELLHGLERASMAAGRRITVPFVRDYLRSQPATR